MSDKAQICSKATAAYLSALAELPPPGMEPVESSWVREARTAWNPPVQPLEPEPEPYVPLPPGHDVPLPPLARFLRWWRG